MSQLYKSRPDCNLCNDKDFVSMDNLCDEHLELELLRMEQEEHWAKEKEIEQAEFEKELEEEYWADMYQRDAELKGEWKDE